jgi:hypothetical protein
LRDLEDLRQMHAGEIAEQSQRLDEAMKREIGEALKQEARKHAQALREVLKQLPERPQADDDSSSKAREHGEAMAGQLEQLELAQALKSGQNALSELAQAERSAPRNTDATKVRSEVRRALERELKWASRSQTDLQQGAEEQLGQAAGDAAERERRLMQKTQQLRQRGNEQRGMPEQMLEQLTDAASLMREAAERLKARQAERALGLEHQAQKLLEEIGLEREEKPEQRSPSSQKGNGDLAQEGTVPGRDSKDNSQEFRRRVLEGLSGDSHGRLEPAIRRYVEGLLK